MKSILINLLITIALFLIGAVATIPILFMLGFGVPGNCEESSAYCTQYVALGAMILLPYGLVLIAALFSIMRKFKQTLKIIYVLLAILPISSWVLFFNMTAGFNMTTETTDTKDKITSAPIISEDPIIKKEEDKP